jgi:hypothetical protein
LVRFAPALVCSFLSSQTSVAFPRVLCDKIFEYVIRSRLSGWSAFEVLDSGFFFLFFSPCFLGACFVSLQVLAFGVVEKKE